MVGSMQAPWTFDSPIMYVLRVESGVAASIFKSNQSSSDREDARAYWSGIEDIQRGKVVKL